MSRPMRSRLIPIIALASLLCGCTSVPDLFIFPGVHKLGMLQGNIIDQEKLDQLEVGMSRAQAQFVMGTPLIADTFDLDRWDYFYEFKTAEGDILRRSVTLHFQEGVLTQIRRDRQVAEETSSL